MTVIKTTSFVAELLGVSYRQLDSWIRHFHLRYCDEPDFSPGSGTARKWDARGIARAQILAHASRTTVALSDLCKVLNEYTFPNDRMMWVQYMDNSYWAIVGHLDINQPCILAVRLL